MWVAPTIAYPPPRAYICAAVWGEGPPSELGCAGPGGVLGGTSAQREEMVGHERFRLLGLTTRKRTATCLQLGCGHGTERLDPASHVPKMHGMWWLRTPAMQSTVLAPR